MIEIRQGHVLEVLANMDAESVQTCVTSPPYWGLRDYGLEPVVWDDPGGCEHEWDTTFCTLCGAWRDSLGLEPTPGLFVEHMVEVFRGVRRVLRDDGCIWVNLGDSYASQGGSRHSCTETLTGQGARRVAEEDRSRAGVPGLKPKDLIGIPWRVAFALQADGWWLRSDIVWAKPNPMPESVTDRPTRAHEYVFLMSKSARYYYDADAVREPATVGDHPRNRNKEYAGGLTCRSTMKRAHDAASLGVAAGRNKRSVWTIATQAFPEAHFATFPEKLVEPCVLAGSSPKACGQCGSPWERVVEPTERYAKYLGRGYTDHTEDATQGMMQNRGVNRQNAMMAEGITTKETVTTGWRPTCKCDPPDDTGQSVVLDPFAGSGTVGLVCKKHGRSFIGIELNPEYCGMARTRLEKAVTRALWT